MSTEALNPWTRLAELRDLSPSIAGRFEDLLDVINQTVTKADRVPGLFLDENDDLEARWLLRREGEERASVVVSATYGETTSIYVYDRSTRSIVHDGESDLAGSDLAGAVAEFVLLAEEMVRDTNGDEVEEVDEMFASAGWIHAPSKEWTTVRDEARRQFDIGPWEWPGRVRGVIMDLCSWPYRDKLGFISAVSLFACLAFTVYVVRTVS